MRVSLAERLAEALDRIKDLQDEGGVLFDGDTTNSLRDGSRCWGPRKGFSSGSRGCRRTTAASCWTTAICRLSAAK